MVQELKRAFNFPSLWEGLGEGVKPNEDKPSPLFHRGMTDFGARQDVAQNALQIGLGPKGIFIDIDPYNPKYYPGMHSIDASRGLVGFKTNPFEIGMALGKGVVGYECDKRLRPAIP